MQAFAVLLAIALPAVLAGRFLDQSQAGVVTTYKIPLQGVWQSFQPSWTSQLTEIDVYLGADVPEMSCVPYTGLLTIYEGKGASHTPFFADSQQRYQQEVEGKCPCTDQSCIGWQTFELDESVSVESLKLYSFHLSSSWTGISQSKQPVPFRIGVIVADAYQRGTNDFSVPGYDYTFKTFMFSSSSDTNVFHTSTTPGIQGAHADQEGQTSQSASLAIGLGVGIALLAICVLAVIAIRRRQHSRNKVQEKNWYSSSEAVAELRRRLGVYADVDDSEPSGRFVHRSAFMEVDETIATQNGDHETRARLASSSVSLRAMSQRTSSMLASLPATQAATVFDESLLPDVADEASYMMDSRPTPKSSRYVVATDESPALRQPARIHLAQRASSSLNDESVADSAYIDVTGSVVNSTSCDDDEEIAASYLELFPDEPKA
eukprot:m.70248 g.70248  ORF g.70248 m.70248 type:complete len:433 (-) comp50121_c0_seq1:88-1386(-)